MDGAEVVLRKRWRRSPTKSKLSPPEIPETQQRKLSVAHCPEYNTTATIRINDAHSSGTDHLEVDYRSPDHSHFCLLARHTPNIFVNGNPVLVTWDEQGRPYFECGTCGRRVKHIYLDALACRTCLHLDYSSRHLHRSLLGVHRIMRWRRMIGIDPHPFAVIPKRPKHHVRFHRMVARIRFEERALLGHLKTVTRDLERRARLRGMLPK